jgi:hypothetical protein
MGWDKISKVKISSVVSFKALALAFFLTPATVAAPPLATPAVAQFIIGIPGIRLYGYGGGGRRYRGGGGGYHHNRHHRGGGGGGGGGGDESNAAPSTPAAGKGVRGTTD